MERLKIQDIIVVEGKDDISAVKKAVDAQILVTNGYSLSKKERDLIKKAVEKKNIIILTDSDYAGETIRKRVEKIAGKEKCKHAFVSKEKSTLNGDIGIENASPEDIIDALKMARCVRTDKKDIFTISDIFKYGLQGDNNSTKKRNFIGNKLGIGYCNSKQFLSRLNSFDISKDEFENANNEYESKKE